MIKGAQEDFSIFFVVGTKTKRNPSRKNEKNASMQVKRKK